METEKDQKELFEFEKPRRAFPRFGRIFPQGANNVGVRISIERVIFISIAVIMLMVILYALGVERGKALRYTEATKTAKAKAPKISPITVAGPAEKANPYTIVVATFANKNTAESEANRMRRDGFQAYASQSDSYYQVRVGAYASRETGGEDLKKIKQRYPKYKDAYLKLK